MDMTGISLLGWYSFVQLVIIYRYGVSSLLIIWVMVCCVECVLSLLRSWNVGRLERGRPAKSQKDRE